MEMNKCALLVAAMKTNNILGWINKTATSRQKEVVLPPPPPRSFNTCETKSRALCQVLSSPVKEGH